MIDVAVLGQPFAAERIVRALNTNSTDLRARFVGPKEYLALLARTDRSEKLVIIRAGYRFGARTPRGRLFDAYWRLLRQTQRRALACHYWVGSDVMRTVDDFRSGRLRLGDVERVRDNLHLTVAPWLTAELMSIGLPATTALLPPPLHIPDEPPPLPSTFSALTYLPSHRFAFFGGPTIMETARRLPSIRFDVVASRGEPNRASPPNVRWHGWVSDMTARYADASVVVRIPEHDGFGKTVIEGLLNARHVLYTHDVPFVRRVAPKDADGVASELQDLFTKHRDGQLDANLSGRAYALQKFDQARLGEDLRLLLGSDR